MLKLYQSNQMSVLAAHFCDQNQQFVDPFEAQTVVVQSFGLGQWLKIKLAEHHGISCNVDCVLPATFLWRLYQSVIPDAASLSESPFTSDRLTWRIMRLIKENPGLSSAIDNYLANAGDADLRLNQLSQEIALLFDEYLMYRPNWILDWSKDDTSRDGHAEWQAKLWKLILDDTTSFKNLHRAALHKEALRQLGTGTHESLPRKISVFGLSSMPPLQLQTFEALAQHVEVEIYYLNPCAHYWGDIVSVKDKARRSIRSLIEHSEPLIDEDYLEIGNPLLASLGKQGREYMEMLLESSQVQSEEIFVELPNDSALNHVKNDILDLTFGGEFADTALPTPVDLLDSSIQIHVCHSRMREVEVLHDEILRALKADYDMALNDIIVMVPDITSYAPYIKSVFTRSLSHRVSDQPNLESTLINSFLTLLKLPESRFTGPEIIDLLETPAVMRRFELTQHHLETIAHWINESGIRWEVSGEKKASNWQVPGDHHNTWEFGLDRLLLGFAMSSNDGLWQGTLPFDLSPSESQLLGKLCNIIEQLEDYRAKLTEDRSLTEWQELLHGLIDGFFEPRTEEILDLNVIFQAIEKLTADATDSEYTDVVSTPLVSDLLRQAFTSSDSRAGFISGGITFATLVPMRSIPFRMVCLLGMNDGEYPRDIRPHSFDLIADNPAQKGDRSKKLDDRYLFLESLLSAQKLFYVSYIGKGIRDNKDRPPSVVINEWINYLQHVFNNLRPVEHALQPFNPKYFLGDDQQSFHTGWYQALEAEYQPKPFVTNELEADESLRCSSISQLGSFFRHPGKFFLQQRLGVYLEQDEFTLKDVESFELDNLEKFAIADAALARLVEGSDLNDFRETIKHTGQLLSGKFGEQQLDREIDRASSIYDELTGYLTEVPGNIRTEIQLAGTSLHLHLDNLYGQELVSYRASQLRARQLLIVWINHLAANASGNEIASTCLSINKGKVETLRIAVLDSATATDHLTLLLSLYDQGTSKALFLPPSASDAFASQYQTEPDSALSKALKDWHSVQPGAESLDRYWQRLFEAPTAFDEHFQSNAVAVWQPLREAIIND